jgi:DEAD/DEAH box helicase domain-containing protein
MVITTEYIGVKLNMSMSNYYKNIVKQISNRSVEATVSILGITDKNLRQHLVQELEGNDKSSGFLADPIFETMFPWESTEKNFQSLSGNSAEDLLLPSLINAMDGAGEHRFGKDWFPFKHQITAWSTLLKPPLKSLIVTSGTGSGKTECFMVPILNDLAQEYEQNFDPLVGVRALFIYPLNALINSQRERLRAWTLDYDDGLKFCLYNGNTKENKHKDQGKVPNEILTRKVMRESPAPMLVTNSTMLEYMLVRQVDEPIIEKSYGKLRWIVLDEAHTYVGSQAAELSLLLRRVMHAFGVEAKNVRFVATSATIGDSNADKSLKEYLANLAGVDAEQIVVVGGKRSVPLLPETPKQNLTLKELASIDESDSYSLKRYNALSANKIALKLRDQFTKGEGIPVKLSQLSKQLFADDTRLEETLSWIDLCSNTSKPGPITMKPALESNAFLPLRGHLFHQVINGLWCCTDKHCSSKEGTSLGIDWPFGHVYTQRRNLCECGAPIFELVSCNDCNAPHLMAIQSNGSLIQLNRESVDEFSLDCEQAEDNESNEDDNKTDESDIVLIAPKPHSELTYTLSMDKERSIEPPGMATFDLDVIDPVNTGCACCEYTGYKSSFYRRSLLSTPFYISNTVPTLLDSCQESAHANERPNRGRRLITFTDSRQGTARISTKIQQDSERDSIRGLIYGSTSNNVVHIDEDQLNAKHEKLAFYIKKAIKLRTMEEDELAEDVDGFAKVISDELDKIGVVNSLNWNDAVTKLQVSQDISHWIFDYYKELNPLLFPDNGGARVLTEMLLLREFSRRPKRQNSMETLGLVSVQYPTLKQISKVPEEWTSLKLSLDDWSSFLKVTLDFHIRENSIIAIPEDWIDWMGAKIYPKSVLGPQSEENTSSRIVKWPQVVSGRNNRLIRILCMACDLDHRKREDKDLINDILKAAWRALTKKYSMQNDATGQVEVHQILQSIPGSVQFQLTREEMAFQACTKVQICPITHRLLDSTFKGISPYLPFNSVKADVICRDADMSVCQLDSSGFNSDLDRKNAVREWVNQQAEVSLLREQNLWTDISDRVVEGGRFYRTAEHSAQQPASKLERYESLFKSGRLNVLNCSTTMEMGVDIGGISVVAMNNVPPHPANYLQRSGRAGRRGETQALSFTICKDNPHERSVFDNPLWPFTTTIAAPYITLNSECIVQRHINSVLLSYFLKKVLTVQQKSITSLNCDWFFSGEDEHVPVDRMLRWLKSFDFEPIPESLRLGIMQIIKGSVLAKVSISQIVNNSVNSLNTAKIKWLPAYEMLKAELDKVLNLSEKDPYRRKVEYDLKCMGDQYLLSELASRAFLPSYGFPTGIVTFDHFSISDFKRGKYTNKSGRIDNQTRMRERPSRDMAVAIREYAPGSSIVLDGLVYKSAGILLNKYSPNEDFSEAQKMLVEWRCHSCGFIGNESGTTFEACCCECGAELKPDHIKEYIEPMGFAVDFYSSPSTDISSQLYVPVQEPWVTANEVLNPLFEPRLGDYRSSSQGHIFNHSSGEHGKGFAVCLRCGKAESMAADGDYPFDLQPGKSHLKLQGKPGPEESARCEGPEENYAIKPNVHLGSTNQTDIFELYLKHPTENRYFDHHRHDPLPWTLAVVLRQALADIHGINADEMGYTIKPSTLPGCSYSVAGIVLFDKCGGGAGFSSSAPRFIKEMFVRALEHLNCVERCDSACQSCLMGYDTRFHMDVLNRHIAIEYINSILPYLDTATEAKLFGESTQYCFESISAEILALGVQGSATLRIFTAGSYQNWLLSDCELKEACLSWCKLFAKVELVLPSQNVGDLSDVHKEDLSALANLGVSLTVPLDETHSLNGNGSLIAQILSDTNITSFASCAIEANVPSEHWWNFDNHFFVKSNHLKSIDTKLLDLSQLATQQGPGDIEVEILSECDGAMSRFGDKLWSLLSEKSEALQASLNDSNALLKISYSDSYICSPWSLILFAEIIDSLKQSVGEAWASPSIRLVTAEKPANPKAKGLYSEWDSSDVREQVISEYFEQMGEEIDVDIKHMKELSHGRILTLSWSDGSESHIRFDHGVGCWSIDGKASKWINLNDEPKLQVQNLYAVLTTVKVKYSKQHPTQIFLKKRSKTNVIFKDPAMSV